MKFDVLWQGKWASVISPIGNPYECFHEPNVILILPVIKNYFVIRKEHCPPYIVKDDEVQLYYTCISGKVDGEESYKEAMLRELQEEAGIKPVDYALLYEKDNVPVCKSSDMRSGIYIMRIDKFDKVDATGDGTDYEAKSKTILVSESKMEEIILKKNVDFLLISMYNMYKAINSKMTDFDDYDETDKHKN